ncbi:MAG: carboxymuconolactone decarboxylase family protein [Phycisphaerales bacterium]|nr:carboxymuconolactone decarboxylase family protein [Phycisphaerales bacterium]
MKKPAGKPPAAPKSSATAKQTESPSDAAPAPPKNGQPAGSEPAIVGDGRVPSASMRSYALLTPDLKELYFKFYKATYGKTELDLKTKEFVAIGAALALGCKGCLEGHLRKAKKEGATAEEISEVIAVTLGVAAATIVDRSDIANFHLGGLFEKPE